MNSRKWYLAVAAAGAVALVAAILTLIDGTGPVFQGEDYYRVVSLGWGAAVMSAAVVVLGLRGIKSGGSVVGYFAAICAATGLLAGGTLPIAICMAVAMAAALLGAVREKEKTANA
jgi:hypothetical protein